MPKTVVAIGCSHTAGSEIDGEFTSDYNRKNSYAGQIAKHLDCDIINLGFNGGSNQYICRAATQFVTQNHYKINEYFFVIGWTSPSRMELRYDGRSTQEFDPTPPGMDPKYVPFSLGQKDNIKLPLGKVTPYAVDIFETSMMFDHWAMYIMSLQNLFLHYKVPYIMCNTCVPLEYTKNSKATSAHIDRRYYYLGDNFYDYSTSKAHTSSQHNHFGEQAHIDWANKLTKELKL